MGRDNERCSFDLATRLSGALQRAVEAADVKPQSGKLQAGRSSFTHGPFKDKWIPQLAGDVGLTKWLIASLNIKSHLWL